jgi:hypothetical protein
MNTLLKASLALTLTASQAMALSCMPPDVARGFNQIASSNQTYVVLNGTFSFAARPPRGDEQRPQTQSYAAKFNGTLLTGNGFTDEISDVLVTINSNCAASWCGDITPGIDYIAFVEQNGRNLTLQAEPCTIFAYPEPTQEQIQRVEDCAAGKACIAVDR